MDSPPPLPPQPSDQDYRNWLDLPLDVTSSILRRLDVVEILTSAQMVCLHWRNVCKDASMWRTLNMGRHCHVDLWIKYLPAYDLCRNICRHAVYLSRGQLVGIEVGCFCDENLLKYITERSRELRYLGAVFWNFSISDKGLSEIAASIPLLEELEISYCFGITEKFLEAVGRSCPHLKSLKLRREVCWGDPFNECDLWAVAIAKNMPGLVSLQLDGNNLTNEGVQVILKGCPRLQSLELRHCRYVTMKGDFERCCSEQIRDLQFHCFSDREFERMLEDRGYYDIDDYRPRYDFDLGFVSD
ncbi:putative F-box/LRR-repeat protein 9 [Juglans microcarpa x Juglans regia]|uniref:putative F-box/LRR-repeat protein 9 n=1 Tax=Juglans microcarpa x Juglans regia TaxID=2249226 RepID=UPI001B7EA4CD|nr:putative F-box/LRR-repeat protein 9 [Juglans microcarpa x Juglans regia]